MAPAKNCEHCSFPSVLTCASCLMAHYCSKEHQKMAWPKHKKLCKLRKAARESGTEMPARETYCGLCGDTAGPLTKTKCCGQTICDDEAKEAAAPFTNASCHLNHKQSTQCSHHFVYGHPKDVLPEDCPKCSSSLEPDVSAYYLTNRFNFAPKVDAAKVPKVEHKRCSGCNKHKRGEMHNERALAKTLLTLLKKAAEAHQSTLGAEAAQDNKVDMQEAKDTVTDCEGQDSEKD